VAPYGQDDLGNLESVFEKPHLVKRAYFLDTQCKLGCIIASADISFSHLDEQIACHMLSAVSSPGWFITPASKPFTTLLVRDPVDLLMSPMAGNRSWAIVGL
jgi:hypothetical protein